MKMTHHRALALLGDYAAGELAVDEYAAITAHLQTCATCRKQLGEIEQIRARLRSFALPVASFEQRNMEFSPSSAEQAWKEEAIVPGQMIGVERRKTRRRPVVLLAVASIAFSLLLSIATIITVMTFQSHSGAQPHQVPTPHPQKHCSLPALPQAGMCASPTPTAAPVTTPTPTPLNQGAGQTIGGLLRIQDALVAVQRIYRYFKPYIPSYLSFTVFRC